MADGRKTLNGRNRLHHALAVAMITSILVLGAGSAGLLTAITLKGRLPSVNLTVLGSKDIGVIGVGEGTTVSVTSHLHGYLGIDPGMFLRESQAMLKLGIRFLWGERPCFDFPFARGLDVRLNNLPNYKFNTRLKTPFWRECREKVNIAGAAEIVEYYQETGPSRLFRHSLLDSGNPFGVEGYLALLVGQNVPYRRTYTPSQTEQSTWERFRATLRQSAGAACSVEETLKHLRLPNWQWRRSTFLSQVPSTEPTPSA